LISNKGRQNNNKTVELKKYKTLLLLFHTGSFFANDNLSSINISQTNLVVCKSLPIGKLQTHKEV
jgi:hypothetical protein